MRFVSDTPSAGLVDDIALVFTSSGTDIKATLRALVDHPDFRDAAGVKVRTPVEDFLTTFRAMQIRCTAPVGDEEKDAAYTVLTITTAMAQRPFDWPRPDGFPDIGETWSSASRMLNCWRIHKNVCEQVTPARGATFKPNSYWLPPNMPIRYDGLIDHVCRLLLGRPADARMIEICVAATGDAAADPIGMESGLIKFRFTLLLLAMLDTPYHMTR